MKIIANLGVIALFAVTYTVARLVGAPQWAIDQVWYWTGFTSAAVNLK
jgi:hypothetical protein